MAIDSPNPAESARDPAPTRRLVNGCTPAALKLSNLPFETLDSIIEYVGANDLLHLQLVSKDFHHLASAALYRALDFNVTTTDTDDRGSTISRAADALQTINISEYNYAQHIKIFRMGVDDAPGPLNGAPDHILTRIVFDSRSDASKFLNTSILQMVRQATILESFRWDIPLELSGPVYQALHKLSSLRFLRIRLDITPAPRFVSRSPSYPPPHLPPPTNMTQPPPPIPSNLMLPPLSQNHSLPAPANASLKRERTRGSAFWAKRRAFGGFSTLQSIEIIRLASLDCLSELRLCINTCSACLKSLTITLDPLVAIRAHKSASSANAQDIDELSDTELEEQEMMFGPMSPSAGGPQPSNEADLRQVKCAQEGILASIFGLEDSAARAKKLEEKMGLPGGQCLLEEEESAVGTKLQDLVKFLEEDEKSPGLEKLSSTSRLEKYRMMRDLANLYISRHAPKPKKTTKSSTKKPASAKKPKKSAKSKLPNIPNMPSSMPSHWDDQLKDIMETQNQSEQNLESSKAALAAIEKSMGIGSASGDLNGMQWSNPSTQLPPLPAGLGQDLSQKLYGSTGSSMDASAPQPWSGEASFIDPLSLSYGSAQSSSQNPFLAPYSSDPYDEALSALYNKSKLQKLHQAQSHVSPGATGASSVSSPLFGASVLPSKSAKKPAPASKKKNGWVSDTTKSSSNTSSSASSAAVSEKGISTSPGKGPLFEAEVNQTVDDGMDVDMDHPDEAEDDSNEDRESASESDDTEVLTPRKRLKPLEIAASSSMASGVNGPAKSQACSPNEIPKATNAEKMHDYVRAAHGIQLETFRLHYVPLKASIVGKALDLTVLQHITLLETGPQDAFWALLVKLTSSDAPIIFKSIHTDNMSFSFLKYLATFKSLEELFVHERKSRNHDTDAENGVDMASISKQALKPHAHSLRRLMLRNERDESWDVDTKTLLSLGAQAPFLEELAINVKTATYHALLQMFPLLRSLRALHLITLRGSDRNNYSMPMESIAYAMDSLTHCPEADLRYIAIGEFVTEMTGRQQYRMYMDKILEKQASVREGKKGDTKGKGKAVDPIPMDIDETSDGDIREKYSRVHSASRKMRATRRFEEIDSVKIFSKEIRNGRI